MEALMSPKNQSGATKSYHVFKIFHIVVYICLFVCIFVVFYICVYISLDFFTLMFTTVVTFLHFCSARRRCIFGKNAFFNCFVVPCGGVLFFCLLFFNFQFL